MSEQTIHEPVSSPIIFDDRMEDALLAPLGPISIKDTVPVNVKSSGIDALLERAISSNVAVENLQKLLDMKYEFEKREAEKQFHAAFAKMQAEFPAIKKKNEVSQNGSVAYRYAALEDILDICKPIMAKHGFSYSWSQDTSSQPGFLRMICTIYGHGHSQSAYADMPNISGTKMMNAAQISGALTTYGKRYSFIGLTGVMCEDDTDGRMPSEKQEAAKPMPPKPLDPKVTTRGLFAKWKLRIKFSDKILAEVDQIETMNEDQLRVLYSSIMEAIKEFEKSETPKS